MSDGLTFTDQSLPSSTRRYPGTYRDQRPAFGATETRHPANQWLANVLGGRRQSREVRDAGQWALWYVRGAMAPEYADWGACARQARRLGIEGNKAARDGLVKGWEDFRLPEMERHLADYRQRYALGWPEERPQDADKVDAMAMLAAGHLPKARVLP